MPPSSTPSSPGPPGRIRFERFELDTRTGELIRDGIPVDLPPQPTKGGRADVRPRISGDFVSD